VMPDADERLEMLARRLGEDRARDVDAERVARQVVARLRREGRTAALAWLRPARVMQVAAAVIILVGAAMLIPRAGREPLTPVASLVPVTLETLGDAELSEVLDSLAFEVPVSELVPIGLFSLSEQELSELLSDMEG